jgi:hypothetical protein
MQGQGLKYSLRNHFLPENLKQSHLKAANRE